MSSLGLGLIMFISGSVGVIIGILMIFHTLKILNINPMPFYVSLFTVFIMGFIYLTNRMSIEMENTK